MSDMIHEILSIWRTVETWQKVAVAMAVIFMFYMLATAVRSPEPRMKRPQKAGGDADHWADGYRTVDSYTKRQ